MRITSAPETSDRPMQPQTKPPSNRVSKKRTLKVVFSLQLFCPLRHPLEAHLNQNPGRPTYAAATTDGQEHRRVSHLRSGCTKTGQTPCMSIHCPPIHALPCPRSDPWDVDDVSMGRADRGSSIAPTGLKSPEGSRPTARTPPPPHSSRSCPCISTVDARARSSVTVRRHQS